MGHDTDERLSQRRYAAYIALIYNWWSLFVRLLNPDKHGEAITNRPMMVGYSWAPNQHWLAADAAAKTSATPIWIAQLHRSGTACAHASTAEFRIEHFK